MKVSVKLTKAEKKKLARLKRDMKNTQGKLLRTYDSMERAWKKGRKISSSVSKDVQDTVKRARKATNEAATYFGKLKRKYRS